MSTSPAQPNLRQYPISDLYLFASYSTRPAYVAAAGTQAPPFNPALPVKQWLDPAPSGQPYLVFDTTAGKTLELPIPASVAGAVNLPGTYNYPAYVETPTDAMIDCVASYVASTPIDPSTLCLQAEAQAIASAITPLFPGRTVTVADGSAVGVFFSAYPTDEPRRQWCLLVDGVSPSGAGFNLYAKTLMLQSYSAGVGAPGHWFYGPIQDEPATVLYIQWVEDPQVTTAPAGAITLPAPIRPLLPAEEFELIPPPDPLFGTATWMVVRTDMQPAITLAQIQQLVAQYNEQPGVAAITIG